MEEKDVFGREKFEELSDQRVDDHEHGGLNAHRSLRG